MTRASLLGVLAVLITMLAVPHPAAAAQQGVASVTIDNVQPSVLVPGRPVQLTGTVRNNTDRAWDDVQVSAVISESPITSRSALASTRAGDIRPALRQVINPGDFDDLGTIEPRTESTFRLRSPYDAFLLPTTSGVHVIGVEVRAFAADGVRQEVAETTTLIPLIGPDAASEPVNLAMLWPLTSAVPRAESGYLDDALAESFASGGRLNELISMGSSAGDFPFTWVVDPAVLDAADDMSDGYTLVSGEEAEEVGEDDDAAMAAATWLSRATSGLAAADVVSVPYGDPDLAALAHGDLAEAVRPAVEAGQAVLRELDVTADGVVWPAAGLADRATLAAGVVGQPSVGLIARQSVAGEDTPATVPLRIDGAELTGLVFGRRVVAPRVRDTMLEWRQQLLAATTMQALEGGGTLIVAPPRALSPDPRWAAADFFGGLQAPWLRPVSVAGLIVNREDNRPRLRYPRRARRSELPARNLDGISALMRTSESLLGVLADPETTRLRLAAATGLAASAQWREAPRRGRLVTSSYVQANRDRLDSIEVEAPSFVTLSGREGPFPVTISNGLSQPITVGIRVQTGNDSLTIEPVEPVTIQPEQRRSIPVQARYRGVGISNVTVSILDGDDTPFGESITIKVRTTQIGTAIWVIMAVGAGIIFVAAVRSVVRRIRGRGRHLSRGPG